MTEAEIRPIPNYPCYLAGSDGSIWSVKNGPMKRLSTHAITRRRPTGKTNFVQYERVALFVDGKSRTFHVHSLVLEAFSGPRPEKMQCRHLDGNPQNNRADNLEWGTCKQNCADKELHGRVPRGEDKPAAKLTVSDVFEIKNMLNNDIPFKAICERFGVCHGTVQSIREGRTWVGVGGEVSKPKGDRCGERSTGCRLTEKDVIEIRRLRKHCGASQSQLAKQYGVNSGTIYCILAGRTWKHLL